MRNKLKKLLILCGLLMMSFVSISQIWYDAPTPWAFRNIRVNGIFRPPLDTPATAENGDIANKSGTIWVKEGGVWQVAGLNSGVFIRNQKLIIQTADYRVSGSGEVRSGFNSPVGTDSTSQRFGYQAMPNANNLIVNLGGSTAVGYRALNGNLGGWENTGMGALVLEYNRYGDFNAAFGALSLNAVNPSSNSSGSYNTAVGAWSGISLTTGSNNVFVGYSAGAAYTGGGGNTFVGSDAGHSFTSSSGSSNIALGDKAFFGFNGQLNDQLRIGNGIYDPQATTIISGDMLVQTLQLNASTTIKSPANISYITKWINSADKLIASLEYPTSTSVNLSVGADGIAGSIKIRGGSVSGNTFGSWSWIAGGADQQLALHNNSFNYDVIHVAGGDQSTNPFDYGNVGIGTNSVAKVKLTVKSRTTSDDEYAFDLRNSADVTLFRVRNEGKVEINGRINYNNNVYPNATGDTYYRDSLGFMTPLPLGPAGYVLTSSVTGIPQWTAASSIPGVIDSVYAVYPVRARYNAGGNVSDTIELAQLWIDSLFTNMRIVNAKRFQMAKGANVASANNLTLGDDGNVFHITGTTQINAITITNWQAGSEIILIFNGVVTVKNNTAGGASTAVLHLAGATDFVTSADDVLTLIYNGTAFYEKSRSVN